MRDGGWKFREPYACGIVRAGGSRMWHRIIAVATIGLVLACSGTGGDGGGGGNSGGGNGGNGGGDAPEPGRLGPCDPGHADMRVALEAPKPAAVALAGGHLRLSTHPVRLEAVYRLQDVLDGRRTAHLPGPHVYEFTGGGGGEGAAEEALDLCLGAEGAVAWAPRRGCPGPSAGVEPPGPVPLRITAAPR